MRNFKYVTINGINLSIFADLPKSDQPIIDLSGADLSYVDFTDGFMRNVNLSGANLTGAKFDNFRMYDVNFENANLTGTEFDNCWFTSWNQIFSFKNADLTNVKIEHCEFRGDIISFENTDFTNAYLYFVEINVENLIDINNLSGARYTNNVTGMSGNTPIELHIENPGYLRVGLL